MDAILGLDLGIVQIVTWVVLIIACASMFALIYQIPIEQVSNNIKKRADTSKERIISRIKRSNYRLFDYEATELFLLSSGADYMFGGKVDAFSYLMIRMGCGVLAGLVAASFMIWLLPVGLLGGYFLPNVLLNISNRQDNDNMMIDIKNMYDTLRVETKAGVYITVSLPDCYMAVKNARLKAALMQLDTDIIAYSDIDTAVDNFSLKFNNKYLDNFCVIVKQSQVSGRTVRLLDDISNQLVDMQHAINIKEKEKLQRKLAFIQVLYYAGVLAVILYVFVNTLANELGGVF